MLDNPVTQKVLATVVAAGIVATSGVAWQTTRTVDRHDTKITQLEQVQTELLEAVKKGNEDVHSEIRTVAKDVNEIKTGVAVLQERTKHYEETAHTHGKPRT